MARPEPRDFRIGDWAVVFLAAVAALWPPIFGLQTTIDKIVYVSVVAALAIVAIVFLMFNRADERGEREREAATRATDAADRKMEASDHRKLLEEHGALLQAQNADASDVKAQLAALNAKTPTDASRIANDFYTLAREIERFEHAEEREFARAFDILRQFRDAPLPDEDKREAEREYTGKIVAALLRFSTEYEPEIRDALKRSRNAGYPDEIGEQIWSSITTYTEADNWPVVMSSRFLLDQIAGRIAKRASEYR